MDGIEAFARLRADLQTKDIPVIAVTASVMSHDQKKILDAGFDGYQRKPLDIKEFLEAVRQALERAP
jgi:two-component system, cell cycle response regulator DivK